MPPASARLSPVRPLWGEDGFTLIELLVSMVLLVSLLGVTLPLVTTAARRQSHDTEAGLAVRSAQTAVRWIDHDLRQARKVYAPNTTTSTGLASCAAGTAGSCVTVSVWQRTGAAPVQNFGTDQPYHDVKFDCSTSRCLRYDTGGPAAGVSILGSSSPPILITNGGAAASCATPTPPPVFVYRSLDSQTGAESCATDPTAAETVSVSLQVPARGALTKGLGHSFIARDDVELRTLNR
jgi:prepilin-type N-terminal cleavage/methylation domain-containing protein